MATLRSKKRLLLYLYNEMDRGRNLNSKNPHVMIDTPTTAEYGNIVKVAFIRPRNITFDRYFFSSQNNSGENLSIFTENLMS